MGIRKIVFEFKDQLDEWTLAPVSRRSLASEAKDFPGLVNALDALVDVKFYADAEYKKLSERWHSLTRPVGPKDLTFSRWIDRDRKRSEQRSASQWQPIDTAPKDRSSLLLWGLGGPRVGFWNGKSWDDGDLFDDMQVSHWMPLPSDPEPPE